MDLMAWTFETLATADRKTLEEVLLSGPPPDFDQMEGFTYNGWNQQPIARITGEKFKKGFRRRDGRPFGYNEVVRQDGQRYRGEWEVKMRKGRPVQIGYFRVGLVRDEPPRKAYRPYQHAGHYNYNVGLNTWRNVPLRVIRDIVVLPNPGDHSVVLGKAHLQFGFPSLTVFFTYFVLGNRRPIEHEPW
jgi:hypothetical protein